MGKKDNKKEAKEKKVKKDKKEKKKKEKTDATEEHEYDTLEATRYIDELLSKDEATMEKDLTYLFRQLDNDEIVYLDLLEHQHLRKKLRHLFQALNLLPAENKGWRRPKKVKTRKILEKLLEARKNIKRKQPNLPPTKNSEVQKRARVETEKRLMAEPVAVDLDKVHRKTVEDDSDQDEEDSDREARAMQAAVKQVWEEQKLDTAQASQPVTLPASSAVKGPAIPTREQLEAAKLARSTLSDDEESSEMGPKPMGEGCSDPYANRRQDLPTLKKKEGLQREEWMLIPGEKMAGCFDAQMPVKEKKKDKFEVERSKKEVEEFQKMFASQHGSESLMDQVHAGKFSKDDLKRARKDQEAKKEPELWGLNEREQHMAGKRRIDGGRKMFDPDKDLEISRPVSSEGFSNMVEAAKNMNDRFSRGGTATSFL